MNSMASVSVSRLARSVIVQTAREFILLPFWWYTSGFLHVLDLVRRSIVNVSKTLGLGVWVKNLFVPMYGDDTPVGRMVSFGIRLFVIMFRGLGVGIWAVIASIGFLLYVFALPLFAIMFLINLLGVMFG